MQKNTSIPLLWISWPRQIQGNYLFTLFSLTVFFSSALSSNECQPLFDFFEKATNHEMFKPKGPGRSHMRDSLRKRHSRKQINPPKVSRKRKRNMIIAEEYETLEEYAKEASKAKTNDEIESILKQSR